MPVTHFSVKAFTALAVNSIDSSSFSVTIGIVTFNSKLPAWRSGLGVGQADLADGTAGSRSKPTNVISYLDQTHRQSFERAAHMNRGVSCRLSFKVILRLAKWQPGFRRNYFDGSGSKFRMRINPCADSRTAEREFLKTLDASLMRSIAISICRA